MKLKSKQIKLGREVAQWVASGCNWAPSPELEATKRAARRALKNPETLRAIGRSVLRYMGKKGGYWTQSIATATVIKDRQWVKELHIET